MTGNDASVDPTPKHLDFPGYDDPEVQRRLRELATDPPRPDASAPTGGLIDTRCSHCGKPIAR